ncbi:MAG: glucosamine-6-phosphate deaminase [Oscillospiraceae bacterium]|nr:glucosamine-6-phosphate deaminase [Oscillospiraceae bacterium]
MEIKILEEDRIAKEAGEMFISQLKEKPDSVLGLATGNTPIETYKYLVSEYKKGRFSFSKAKTFNLDEYCNLEESDKNSYHYYMKENLFDEIDIKKGNTNIPDGNNPDAAAECENYDKNIEAAGGIDLQLLGIGENGHIGFNEPPADFTKGTFKIKLSESTKNAAAKSFPDGNVPEEALTMGTGTIMKAKKIILIATGPRKAGAVKDFIERNVSPDCPASILQEHPDVTVFLDGEAAGLLMRG